MYDQNQEIRYDNPIGTPSQSELAIIIERLQSALQRYDDVVCKTESKLQMITKYVEPSPHCEESFEKHPENVIETIKGLLFVLDDLNIRSEINLRHLAKIV